MNKWCRADQSSRAFANRSPNKVISLGDRTETHRRNWFYFKHFFISTLYSFSCVPFGWSTLNQPQQQQQLCYTVSKNFYCCIRLYEIIWHTRTLRLSPNIHHHHPRSSQSAHESIDLRSLVTWFRFKQIHGLYFQINPHFWVWKHALKSISCLIRGVRSFFSCTAFK